MENIIINTPFIRLDTFLKLSGLALTGGQAKLSIQSGQVTVDGEICTMRGKKLVDGAVVETGGQKRQVKHE